MAKVTLYNQVGKSVGELTLDAALFEVKPNPALIHEAFIAQKANSRVVYAHTKDRSEVAGTGKKPWKQKGTGQARHGSRRSPIWVGGGITFGPTKDRNFSVKLNKTAKRKALAMVLTDKVACDKFVAIDTMVLSEAKTKNFAAVLKSLPSSGKKTLVVLEPTNVLAARAARNLPRVKTLSALSLNIGDLLANEFVIASKEAIDSITKTFKRA
ncbi:50S ribosomal protein L4 [bacterium]|nr:50S ribosomal protein L4 [bacterium]